MSATAPTRPSRRPVSMSGTTLSSARPSTTTPQNPSGTTLVAKGSISRTSPSPKATPLVRRSTASSRPSSSLSNSRDGVKDTASAKLKDSLAKDPLESKEEGDNAQDTTNTDELRIRIQDLDSTVSTLSTENTTLQTALTRAETRLTELYADQARTDEELGLRHELAEKLRSQIRELEKEKRELTRRYNEQTNAFEAERQSFYDNEQHLKSRIQALSQSKKQERHSPVKNSHHLDTDSISIVSEVEYPPPPRESLSLDGLKSPKNRKQPKIGNEADNSQEEETGDDTDTPEMIALKLELSTLSTSHNSLQSTLHLLQTQLLDLQRVNAELQEENEGWKVLVQQRTLAGTFDVLSLGGATLNAEESSNGDEASSMKSSNRNTLDKVSEMDEIAYEAGLDNANGMPQSLAGEMKSPESTRGGRPLTLESELFSADTSRDDSPASKRSRRRGTITAGDVKGESLADLPLTGPGLDLAAELGRAQNAEGFITGGGDPTNDTPKKQLTASELQSKAEIEGLKTEVKNLKEANKALSLYASKIIDRIIATEGFENVLAVDFHEKVAAGNKTTPTKSRPKPASLSIATGTSPVIDGPRTALPKEKLTTFESIGLSGSSSTPSKTVTATPHQQAPPSPMPAADPKRSRRSMSFDWRGFSLFGGSGQSEADKKVSDPSLRPLTLRPGAPSWTTNSSAMNARKLETTEDDEDRRERERLRATMRLMGIDPDTNNQRPMVLETSQPSVSRSISSSSSSVNKPNGTSMPPSPKTATANPSSRWSLFGRKNTNDATPSASGSSSSLVANSSMPTAPLTTEALQQAEAEQHIAALEAREQVAKEEIAKGGSSGFTELTGANGAPRRRIGEEWRSRRNSASIGGLEVSRSQPSRRAGSSAGSASTVWSAGKDDD
ncbi:hypothetical protein CPB86DRAFT_735208 [Serendipita vermifera]|nr:hypothetical protein CPB86DRAFT_735208 [Serendipita vermifera]